MGIPLISHAEDLDWSGGDDERGLHLHRTRLKGFPALPRISPRPAMSSSPSTPAPRSTSPTSPPRVRCASSATPRGGGQGHLRDRTPLLHPHRRCGARLQHQCQDESAAARAATMWRRSRPVCRTAPSTASPPTMPPPPRREGCRVRLWPERHHRPGNLPALLSETGERRGVNP
jgi:hypothetical protein